MNGSSALGAAMRYHDEHGGGSTGSFVGMITQTTIHLPTTRLDGTELQDGDYVTLSNQLTFPYTIDGVTFNSSRDKGVYQSSAWQVESGISQDTDETPVSNPNEESLDGTKDMQNKVNKEFVEALKHLNIPSGSNLPSGTKIGEVFILLQDVEQSSGTVKAGLYRYNGTGWELKLEKNRESTRIDAVMQKLRSSQPVKIVCLGDSITFGANLHTSTYPQVDNPYPLRLQSNLRLLYDYDDITVVNMGTKGEQSGGGLSKINNVIAENPDLVFIMYGTNDSGSSNAIKTFIDNMYKMYLKLNEKGIPAVFVIPPTRFPVNSVSETVIGTPGANSQSFNIKLYDTAEIDFCKNFNIPYIDLRPDLRDLHSSLKDPFIAQPDGVHFENEYYGIIGDIITKEYFGMVFDANKNGRYKLYGDHNFITAKDLERNSNTKYAHQTNDWSPFDSKAPFIRNVNVKNALSSGYTPLLYISFFYHGDKKITLDKALFNQGQANANVIINSCIGGDTPVTINFYGATPPNATRYTSHDNQDLTPYLHFGINTLTIDASLFDSTGVFGLPACINVEDKEVNDIVYSKQVKDVIFYSDKLRKSFRKLESLKCLGNQYIPTNISQTSNTEYRMGFKFDKTQHSKTAGIVGGTPASSTSNAGNFYVIVVNDSMYAQVGSAQVTYGKIEHDKRYDIKLSVSDFNVNGVSNATGKTAITTYGYCGIASIYVNKVVAANSQLRGDLYYAQVYESGVLVQDYIPVVDTETGEAGIYERISETFYTNDNLTANEEEKFISKSDVPKLAVMEIEDESGLVNIDLRKSKLYDIKNDLNIFEDASHNKYHRVKYLQNTAQQYINTGLSCIDIAKDEIEFSFDTIASDQVVGGAYDTTYKGSNYIQVATSKVSLYGNATQKTLYNAAIKTGMKYKIIKPVTNTGDAYMYTEDGTQIGTVNIANANQETLDIYLFTLNLSGSPSASHYSKIKLYEYIAYDISDVEIMHLIPVKKVSNGEYGMFDTVSNTFIGNSGTDSFSGGEDLAFEKGLYIDRDRKIIKLLEKDEGLYYHIASFCYGTVSYGRISILTHNKNKLTLQDWKNLMTKLGCTEYTSLYPMSPTQRYTTASGYVAETSGGSPTKQLTVVSQMVTGLFANGDTLYVRNLTSNNVIGQTTAEASKYSLVEEIDPIPIASL